MATKPKANIRVGVDEKPAVEGLKRLSGEWGKFATVINESLEIAGKAFGALNTVVGKFAGLAGEAIKLADEQARVEGRLATALKLRGEFTESGFKAMKDYASSIQEATVYGDEQILSLQSQLLAMGLHRGELKEATKATIGLAEVTGGQLADAGKTVAKVLAGDVGALKEVNIHAKDAQDGMRQLTDLFVLAEQRAQTFGGQMKQLSNAYGDLLEKLGEAIIKSPEVIQLIEDGKKKIVELTEYVKNNGPEIEKFIRETVTGLRDLGKWVIDHRGEIQLLIELFIAAKAASVAGGVIGGLKGVAGAVGGTAAGGAVAAGAKGLAAKAGGAGAGAIGGGALLATGGLLGLLSLMWSGGPSHDEIRQGILAGIPMAPGRRGMPFEEVGPPAPVMFAEGEDDDIFVRVTVENKKKKKKRGGSLDSNLSLEAQGILEDTFIEGDIEAGFSERTTRSQASGTVGGLTVTGRKELTNEDRARFGLPEVTAFDDYFDAAAKSFEDGLKALGERVSDFGALASDTLSMVVQGIGNAVATSVTNMILGLDEAKKSFGQLLGDLLVGVGQMLISTGTAALILGALSFIPGLQLVTGGPGAAIAGGVAAIAAGTAMVGIGGALGGGRPAGGGASAPSASSSRSAPRSERPSAPVGFSTGSSGGPQVVQITNNFNRPVTQPRRTARDIEDSLRRLTPLQPGFAR